MIGAMKHKLTMTAMCVCGHPLASHQPTTAYGPAEDGLIETETEPCWNGDCKCPAFYTPYMAEAVA